MNEFALQIFLIVNVFFIGVIATLALQQWQAHHRGPKQPDVALPPSVTSQLVQSAEQRFSSTMDEATQALQKDLAHTNRELNALLEKLVTYVVNEEMERYRASLNALHADNEATLKQSLTDTTAQHIDFKTKLIRRQAELDHKLVEYQTTLESQLAAHQADADEKLTTRQSELEAKLQDQQAQHASHQAELEARLKKHQAGIEAELSAHQTELMAALKNRQAKLAEYQTILEGELTAAQTKQVQLYQQLEDKVTA